MNNKVYTTLALLTMTSAVVSPGKNTASPAFPLWPALPTVTAYSQSLPLATPQLGGYQCIRANLYYSFPQGNVGNNVISTTAL